MTDGYIDTYYRRTRVDAPDHSPLQAATQADVCIIGGGLAGLSTAHECQQRGLKVALLETHRIACKPAGDQDEIMEDFAQIRQKDMEKDGKLKIVPKDEVREALGRSPDVGDTFIMRMYFELIRDAAGRQNAPYERSVRELNARPMRRETPRRGT